MSTTSDAAEPPSPDLVRVRLDLSYDGTDFAGWAAQPGQRTVQGTLEDALATILRLPRPVRLTVAGRTDAGVHARGQVAHLDVPRQAWDAVVGRSDRSPGASLVIRLAGLLGTGARPRGTGDLVVHRATEAPAGFDARFSALWRRYRYRVADSPSTADPLRRREVLRRTRPLEVEPMDDAAGRLLGEHDFAAYCKPREGATTIRTLLDFRWSRVPAFAPDAGLVIAEVRADAFCRSMVRALVGACFEVGHGRRDERWPARVLQAGLRDSGVTVAPAHGLTLEEVAYPPDDELAARAAASRGIRTLSVDEEG
ncbi:tRNA pseudouridine(38-40) synthase TruA [Georgenia halophila]|uniref:tRNA pseudouridine synthase A n=1 Tax=Georgenia halophila TaxID=620889 RepID=A0ABP8KVX6_9MICO